MKLYLLSQTANNDCDTFDSLVVAAPDEETAKNIIPGGNSWANYSWVSSPDLITCAYLGEADKKIDQGIILASFNAG